MTKPPSSSQFNLSPPFYGPHSPSSLLYLPWDPLKHFLSQADAILSSPTHSISKMKTSHHPASSDPPLLSAQPWPSASGDRQLPLGLSQQGFCAAVLQGAVWEALSPLTLTRTSRLFLFNTSSCCRPAIALTHGFFVCFCFVLFSFFISPSLLFSPLGSAEE